MMLPAGKVSPLSRCPIKSDHDLHLLEKQRTALAEYVFALLEPGLKTDGPNLPASQRYVRHFLGDADPTLEATLLRHREMARNALHLRVVEPVGGELEIRSSA